jgi:nucleoid DNA-binding protein
VFVEFKESAMPAKKKAAKTRTTARKATRKTTARKPAARKTAAKKKPAAKKTTRKAPAKRTAAKKTTARKATTRKSTAKKTVRKTATKSSAEAPALNIRSIRVKEPMTKAELMDTIAGLTGLQKRDVKAVYDALMDCIGLHLQKSGPRVCVLPGIAKLTVQRKPATRARKGINPFTGEETMFKAKPARNVVKARVLKSIKDMAA